MIGLVLSMLRARPAAALTLGLLAMFATAAAVAGPAYLDSVDRAVVDQEVAGATPDQLSIGVTGMSDPTTTPTSGLALGAVAPTLADLPGFTVVPAVEVNVLGLAAPGSTAAARLVSRPDVCAHLVVLAGRCPAGVSEVLVGERTARRLGLHAGEVVTLTYAMPNPDRSRTGFVPGGAPAPFTVTGIYRPRQVIEAYWGRHGYFAPTAAGPADEPVFATPTALTVLDHKLQEVDVDAFAGRAAFTPDRLPALRARLAEITDRDLGLGVRASTGLPGLLDRMDRSRQLAHQVVPVAGVPLVVLAWFVIFLAVGYATEGRRLELGLVALRGARLPVRCWLAAGECLLPIGLGAVLGYLAGPLLIRLGTPGATAGAGLPGGTGGWLALGAGAGAVLAALAAQWRALRAPVADLLRRVPARATTWGTLTVEAVIVVLAVLATVQLRVSGGQLTGLGALVPALVAGAVAVLAARALLPLAGRYSGRALRRGRLGLALAAVQLGRQPGIQRLFVLLVAAMALLGFAASAAEVAGRARTDRAQIGTGATRVLAVDVVTRQRLLRAVRAVDPQGRYAMAVAGLPEGAPGEVPRLAVDATRLARAALWRPDFGPLSPTRVAALLHPDAPAPVLLRDGELALDVTAGGLDERVDLRLGIFLAPLSGAEAQLVELGLLESGARTYRKTVDGCADGCRLVGIRVWTGTISGYRADLTFTGLHQTGSDGIVRTVPLTPQLWRAPARYRLDEVPEGLRARLDHVENTPDEGLIRPVDVPDPVPVVGTGALPTGTRLAGLDGRPTQVTQVGTVAGLPRLGNHGVLVDLEYADRAATDSGTATDPQVWLGPGAPADIVDRLTAQGLVVTADRSLAAVQTGLDREGPALALRFHLLAAGFAVLLAAGGIGLVAAVDRRRRADDLRALRVQGVGPRVVGRAASAGYLAVVLAALAVGLVAATVAWAAAGWGIPVFVDGSGGWPRPRWPRPLPVLGPWLVAGLALLALGWLAALRLRAAALRAARPDPTIRRDP
jgi:hypothetical protein